MFLLAQLAISLFITFLLGVGVGYALWRTLGERDLIAKYHAAEMELAKYLSQWEAGVGRPGMSIAEDR